MDSLSNSLAATTLSSPAEEIDRSLIIPDDCWYRILSYLDAKSLAAFGMTSRRNYAVHKDWLLWIHHFLRDFGLSFWRGEFGLSVPEVRHLLFTIFFVLMSRHLPPFSLFAG